MSPPAHEIVVIPPKDESRREECYNVRIQVFVHEQGFPLDTEIDESVLGERFLPLHFLICPLIVYVSRFDGMSTHFLLRLVPSLIPIGTIRTYSPNGASYYKLSRLAVLKEYRQFKFGRDLVFALHDWVKAETKRIGGLDYAEVIAHSQIPVKPFYAK
jgi:predicted GNAT family N-acyltransferase